jgi:hypothetical protein
MRYHIEWAYLAEDNIRVLYDETIKDWSLTFPQAISLARRMGYKKYGDWAYEVTVTALDKCGSPEDRAFYRHLHTQGRLL